MAPQPWGDREGAPMDLEGEKGEKSKHTQGEGALKLGFKRSRAPPSPRKIQMGLIPSGSPRPRRVLGAFPRSIPKEHPSPGCQDELPRRGSVVIHTSWSSTLWSSIPWSYILHGHPLCGHPYFVVTHTPWSSILCGHPFHGHPHSMVMLV